MALVTLDWLHLVALLGAAQGIFLTAVLAFQRRNRTANRLLAAAMFAFSIYLASAVYLAAGLERVFPHFFGLAYPLPLLFGPLIYLYAVCASDRTRRLRRGDWLHFLPFLAVVVGGLPIYLKSGPEKLAFYDDLQRGIRPGLVLIVDPIKYLSGITYAAATILFLRKHRGRVRDNYSTLERVNLQWLLLLAGGAAAVWALATMLELMQLADHPLYARGDDLVALAIALLVYASGYMALRQPEIFNYARLDVRIPGGSTGAFPIQAPSTEPGPANSGHGAQPEPGRAAAPGALAETTPRYERSGLGEREAEALQQTLLTVMEAERPYQNGDLTLADLAERLETTPHKLSELLNSQLEQTFYDFINTYRVREVQRRIADQRFRNLTILALAMDAGFASKSTFNHVFKKHTGQTPSSYRRAVAG